jgi:hypothetical protein
VCRASYVHGVHVVLQNVGCRVMPTVLFSCFLLPFYRVPVWPARLRRTITSDLLRE